MVAVSRQYDVAAQLLPEPADTLRAHSVRERHEIRCAETTHHVVTCLRHTSPTRATCRGPTSATRGNRIRQVKTSSLLLIQVTRIVKLKTWYFTYRLSTDLDNLRKLQDYDGGQNTLSHRPKDHRRILPASMPTHRGTTNTTRSTRHIQTSS